MPTVVFRRAENDYTCEDCGQQIEQGEEYKEVSPCWLGAGQRHRECSDWTGLELEKLLPTRFERVVVEAEQELDEDANDYGLRGVCLLAEVTGGLVLKDERGNLWLAHPQLPQTSVETMTVRKN